MKDYRSQYIGKEAVKETYGLEIKGDHFVFTGDAGTVLQMKPILPKRIEVDQGDSVMIITKNKMIVKNISKKQKVEQQDLGLQ